MGARLPAPAAPGGLLEALRAIGATLGEIVRVRGALISVELREEIERRKQLLILATAGILLVHTGFLLFTVLVAAFFWDTHRLAAIGAMAFLYLAAGAALFAKMRLDAAAGPAPFAATLEELAQDVRALRRSQ